MLKQISKIKTIVLNILEKELITVLALGIVMLGIWFVKADTDTTNLSFTILDSGTITVTAPNGGEDWQVDSTQHITWDTTGSIANVKIELQREVDGSWETLISSTPNDGDYPWPVTSPTTTTATVRITSTNVPAITDSSDEVFTISPAPEPETPSSPGGYLPTYPAIDSISPMSFYYNVETELTIRGVGFQNWAWATLNQVVYPIQKPNSLNLILMSIPANTLQTGTYRVCVYNSDKEFDCYPHLINITSEKIVVPPTTGGEEETYKATLVRQAIKSLNGNELQSEQQLVSQTPNITLKVRDEVTVWVEYKNTGTATWYQDGEYPVRLGTDNKRDRRSGFYHSSWIKYNRPVLVDKIVKPGEIGRFEFTIKAPWAAKTYTEYFRPVAEWKAWMSGQSQVKWVITVKSKSLVEWFRKPAQPSTPSVKPTIPSTGGQIDLPFQPKDTLLFSDSIEKVYQKTIQFFAKLINK